MLSDKPMAVTNLGAEWVLWLLVLLSIVSVGIAIERGIFFSARRLADSDAVAKLILKGDFGAAQGAVEGQQGMEADGARPAIESAPRGVAAVEEVIEAQLARSRLDYERNLAFL